MITKSVVFITEMDFWRSGSGCRERSLNLVKELCKFSQLTVISCCARMPADDALIKRLNLPFAHHWLAWDVGREEQIELLKPIIAAADSIIIRSIKNAYLFPAAPPSAQTFLDIDDLQSDYCETKIAAGLSVDNTISFNEEIKVFDQFHKLIVIQEEHFQKLSSHYPPSKIILAPPPIRNARHIFREQASRIGFFASGWEANIDGLNWFLKEVWPEVARRNPQLTLNIYGLICSKIKACSAVNMKIMGSVSNISDVYDKIDIAINPVRYGSGIKIKTLEAIGQGIPLVTTQEGARGLRRLNKSIFLIADSAQEFALHLDMLARDSSVRKQLHNNGIQYIRDKYNHEVCFESLRVAIKGY